MEFNKNEFIRVEQTSSEESDPVQALVDLELVAVGGGIGDPIAY